MPFPVKNFLSTDQGLGGITSSTGSLVEILNKCLVAGFNQQTVSAATYSVANDEFTITVPSGHGYRADQILMLSGATEAGYNVEMRVLSIGDTSVVAKSHADETKPTSTSATGTLSIKAAPQGTWTMPYTGTDKAVFKINGEGNSGCYLRIDNSIACSATLGMYCLVDGYGSMSDVDTGTNYFGYQATPTQNVWGIRARTSYSDTGFIIVSDNSAFWLYMKVAGASGTTYDPLDDRVRPYYWRKVFFGDLIRLHSSDIYNCTLVASAAAYATVIAADQSGTTANPAAWSDSATATGICAARSISGDIGRKTLTIMRLNFSAEVTSGRGPLAYPQIANNSLVVQQYSYALQDSASQLRGYFPGILSTPQDLVTNCVINPTTKIIYLNKLLITTWFTVATASTIPSTNGSSGCDFIDITGPWR